MDEIWKRKFENKKVEFPNEIAIEYCNKLYELTNNLVIAKVEKYNKSISDMNESSPLITIASANVLLKEKKAEQYLGEISGSSKFTYEMYLTGVNTPKYKYRFCFVENGVYPYPVVIVVDNDIAKELNIETRIKCESEIEYREVLKKVLNTNKLSEVIEGLMAINSNVSKE